MKKMVTLCTVLALAIAFASCSSDGGSDSPPPSSPGGDPKPIKAGLYAKTIDKITGDDEPLKPFDKTSATTATTTYTAAITYAKANPAVYTLLLDADVSIAGGDDSSTDATILNVNGLTLRLEGLGANRTISVASESTGRLFTVALNSKLVLGDKITLKGIAGNNQPVVYIGIGGRVEMYTGAAITGNDVGTLSGGGVLVYEGTFTMEGGSITSNKSHTGGGVDVISGTFTMLGGTISGNEAGNGGGVNVGGTFILQGGSITGNTANGPNDDENNKDGGGGVSLGSSGRFNMTGGSITNNTANKYGGGVKLFTIYSFNMSQYFNMLGGTISGNTAGNANGGGGVYLYGSTSYFYLNSPAVKASVSGNSSPAGTANQVVTEAGGQISGSDSGNQGWPILTDTALNGTWAPSDGPTYKFNNGTYEFQTNNKGTFTTSGDTLTMTLTHVWQGSDNKWYTKAELIAAGVSETVVNNAFAPQTYTYAISDGTLTLTTQVGAVYTYTKQ